MPLTSFCGLLTLQVGAAVISAVFITLSAVILAANLLNYTNNSGHDWPINLVLLLLFVALMLVAAVLIFSSSYAESRPLAIMGMIFIVIFTCYFVILCCFSFASSPQHVDAVCIDERCPETLWIANLRYRTEVVKSNTSAYDDDDDDYKTSNVYRDDPYDDSYDKPKKEDEPARHKYNKDFVAAIILFIINVLFFLFCAFVLWSWASELDWADYYIEDEPVVVYEDPYDEPY